jgi:hypothetical protein
MPPPYYTNFFIRKANDGDESRSDEENEDGQPKAKYYEKKERYYPRDYDYGGHYYKPKYYKEYDKNYDKGYEKTYDKGYERGYEKGYDKGYYGKNSSYNAEGRGGYEHGDKNKNRDYKERKPYDSNKKSYPRGGKNKQHTPGQKYYYEPKQVKVDAENFPPLIVKEGFIEMKLINF